MKFLPVIFPVFSMESIQSRTKWLSSIPNRRTKGRKAPVVKAGEDWRVPVLGARLSLRINDQHDQTGQTWAPCWNTQLYTAYQTLDLKNKTNRIPGNWSTIYRQAQIWTVIDQLQMVWYDTYPLFTAAIFTLFSTSEWTHSKYLCLKSGVN